MVDPKKPVRIGIIANAIHARNFYKIIGRWVTMKVSGIYEVDFVEMYGLKKYKEMVLETPEEVMRVSDIVIIHSNDLNFDSEVLQKAFNNNLSVITTDLPFLKNN